jgi:hypothetical protein
MKWNSEAQEVAPLSGHLVPLPGEPTGRWALWRTFAVRGAGFPAADVLRLADAGCAAAADRMGALEDEAESLRQAALEALRAELAGAAKGGQLDTVVKAIRRLKRRRPVAAAGFARPSAEALAAWEAA